MKYINATLFYLVSSVTSADDYLKTVGWII
jgi:hypothetical protein